VKQIALFTLVFIIAALCFLIILFIKSNVVKKKLFYTVFGIIVFSYISCFFFGLRNWLLSSFLVLLTGIFAGYLISRLLTSKAALVSFCLVAAFTDYLSFTRGLSKKIISAANDGSSALLQFLTVSYPWNQRLVYLIGIGDILILSVLFSVLARYYQPIYSFTVPVAGLMLAIIIGILTGPIFAVPFISATTIIFIILYKKAKLN
jgi:hypothetical protein